MAEVIHVAVQFSLFPYVYNAVCQGITDYVRRQAPRKIIVTSVINEMNASALARSSNADGLMVMLRDPVQCASLRRFRRPIVNLLDQYVDTPLPTVCPDDRAVGALGARHLLDCGFKELCFIGNESAWSVAREEGFVAAATSAGARILTAVSLLELRARLVYWEPVPAVLRRIVRRLPERCGVMTCNDRVGAQLIGAAINAGRRIPDDIAVIGTDDDPIHCESPHVPLSSIPLDYRQIGIEAMGLLDRQIKGEAIGKKHVLVPPKEVVCRRSTDVVVYQEPSVSKAIRFIRAHACEGIDVPAVLKHVVASRTGLDRLFRKYVGHTPADEIRRVRLETAKRLLLESDLRPVEIAQRSGFCSQSHLTQHFRKAFGQPPYRFRAMAQRAAGNPKGA